MSPEVGRSKPKPSKINRERIDEIVLYRSLGQRRQALARVRVSSIAYWSRLRGMAAYAKQRDMLLGISVFFGWPKHDEPNRNDWAYHPLNAANGGHLGEEENYRTACIASPGTEVRAETWSDAWSKDKKTQWIWERLAQKLIDELSSYHCPICRVPRRVGRRRLQQPNRNRCRSCSKILAMTTGRSSAGRRSNWASVDSLFIA